MYNKKHKRTLHVQQKAQKNLTCTTKSTKEPYMYNKKFIQQKEAPHCGGPVTASIT